MFKGLVYPNNENADGFGFYYVFKFMIFVFEM